MLARRRDDDPAEVPILNLFLAATLATRLSLTVIPPTPVAEPVTLDIRAAVANDTDAAARIEVTVYLDRERPGNRLHRELLEAPARTARGIQFRWPAKGHAGRHELLMVAKSGGHTFRERQKLEVLSSADRTTGKIDGAWLSILLPNDKEGLRMNPNLERLTDDQWREQVRGIHSLRMNVIVLEEVFRNTAYPGKHHMERDGYHGLAFYDSKLYPGRVRIAARNPIEAILSEADRLGMQVFLGIGAYAWFDFSPGALAWHKRVATEIWQIYGHHPSFYGWYVSAEVCGNLLPCVVMGPEEARAARAQIVSFFREFRAHCREMAPDKPILLAPNSHFMKEGEDGWRELLRYCDIVCPFGFHRQPKADVAGEQVAAWLQKLADESGSHLWMDLETFVFEKPGGALVPRPIGGLLSDLRRFRTFEKILCFEYPGLMSAPGASAQPGGPETEKLYRDYRNALDSLGSGQHGMPQAAKGALK